MKTRTLILSLLLCPLAALAQLATDALIINQWDGADFVERSFDPGAGGVFGFDGSKRPVSLARGNLTETGSSVLTITGGTAAVFGSGLTLQVAQASGSQSGYLSSADWTAFNAKAAASHTHPVADLSDATAFTRTFLAAVDAAAARALLDLEIGTDVQAYDADLAAYATAADAAARRALIGAGTSNFSGAYGDLSGIPSTFTPASHTHPVADLSDATAFTRTFLQAVDAAAARALLDLEPGTDVQAYDAQLSSLAGLSYSGNAGLVIKVNATADGFELATDSTGSGALPGTPAEGDLVYFDGADWVSLGIGTAGQVLKTNGTADAPEWGTDAGGSTGANPTATVGLTAVNGVATTFMRSDAAPPLAQTISPTMTGQWRFQNGVAATPTLIGATSNSTSLSNNTLKAGPLAVPHYTNAEEPVLMFAGESGSSDSTLYVGGASPSLNAVTRIDFYVATTNTTTAGTRRARLTSAAFIMEVPTQMASYTVGALPTASSVPGALAYVTDATATTRLSVAAGGGSNKVIVFSDGTDWLIL